MEWIILIVQATSSPLSKSFVAGPEGGRVDEGDEVHGWRLLHT